jgi:hypothetical protein
MIKGKVVDHISVKLLCACNLLSEMNTILPYQILRVFRDADGWLEWNSMLGSTNSLKDLDHSSLLHKKPVESPYSKP